MTPPERAAALARCDAEKNGRKGGWIQTYTGVTFYPLDPRPDEAYLVDLPRPIKRYAEFGPLYQSIESNLMLTVCERFGLHPNMPISVKRMDTRLLVTEKRDLMNACPKPWEDTEEPLPDPIFPMPPRVAEILFLQQFEFLTREKRAIEREEGK